MFLRSRRKIESLTDTHFEGVCVSYPLARGVVGLYKKIKWLNALPKNEISGDDVITYLSPKLLHELEHGSKNPIYRRALHRAGVHVLAKFSRFLSNDELIEWKDSFDYEARRVSHFKAGKESIQLAQLGLFLSTSHLGKEDFGTQEYILKGAIFGLSQEREVAKLSAIYLIYHNHKVDAAIASIADSYDRYSLKSKGLLIESLYDNRKEVVDAACSLGDIGKIKFVRMLDSLIHVSPRKTLSLIQDISTKEKFKKLRSEINLSLSHGMRELGESDFERLTGLDCDELLHSVLQLCIDVSKSEKFLKRAKSEFLGHGTVALEYVLECAKDETPNSEIDKLLFEFIAKFPVESLYWLKSRASYLPVTESLEHNHLLDVFWSVFFDFIGDDYGPSHLSDPKFIGILLENVETDISQTHEPPE